MSAFNEKELKEYWCGLPNFIVSYDIPPLPNPLTDYYKLKLIEKGALIKKELVNGKWYYGNHRCTTLGRWNEEKQEFDYWNYSFGYYMDVTNHFQDDDGYALFVPIREASETELKEILKIEKDYGKKHNL